MHFDLLLFHEIAGAERVRAAGGDGAQQGETGGGNEPEMRGSLQGGLIVEENQQEANGE